MKIVRKTESELVTADSGLFLFWLFALIGVSMLVGGMVPGGRQGLLFGAGFLLLCAGICLRKTTFVFDRARGMAFWRRRKMFTTTTGEIPFGDIADIGFDAIPDQHGVNTYRLVVITAAGRTPMADMYGSGQKYYEGVRDAIVEFLAGSGAPVNAVPVNAAPAGKWDDESSLRAMIQQGRKLDAIAFVRSKENLDLLHAKERVDEIDRQMKEQR